MDKETRNRIQRATQDARALLEREYAEQLEGIFDIRLDGYIAAEPGSHLDAQQRVLRTKLVAAVEHLRSGGLKKSEAVAGYLREAAFTMLNRFVALKMLEARGLVQECISRGEQSTGFKEFTGLAPGLVQFPDHGYRLYIECLFDEIGREVRVLFDRRDPASLLWPRRQTLVDLLVILNAPELAEVWKVDETIGWVYQYFNSDEERRQMRAESQAPRNSRELAVRNQFFTPRYVVEFLTDNTLGRIWYEMRQGKTRLVDECDYLVRRPNEVFLAEHEQAPTGVASTDEDLTQGDLLKKTVYVPFRPQKDPRNLKILDPACGSGHFLLYAFDLLVTIYEEAWEDDNLPLPLGEGGGEGLNTLRKDYPTLESLRAAVPSLILRHNLHGIDIDPRAAQIAALALWMRAQRAYNDFGIPRGERPPIVKTNIVVAEPMPGEEDLRETFVGGLDELLGELFQRVVRETRLAGEAGSLLKVEEAIRRAIRDVYGEHGPLFLAEDEEQWANAERNLFAALEQFARQAADGTTYARRLFAHDAARGFGFIDLCWQRYDVVLMNPPFGEPASRAKQYLIASYPRSKNDLLAAFVERGVEWLHPRAMLGAITSRTCFFLSSFQKWREGVVLGEARPTLVADLGYGVMDAAMVEAAAYCLEKGLE